MGFVQVENMESQPPYLLVKYSFHFQADDFSF